MQKRRFETLRRDTPCAAVYLDETGAISRDRFFAVGVVKMQEPSQMLRAVTKFRDRRHWYHEFKFSDVTRGTLGMYMDLTTLAWESGDPMYFCFVADRKQADPIARFGDPWSAYLKMAEQLIVATIRPTEIVSVLADNYSTPDEVLFEEDLRQSVNRRLRRLAVTTVARMDSRATDALQVVDLFTSATAFEFRANAGLASATSHKSALAEHVRSLFGIQTSLEGFKSARVSVQLYDHQHWPVQSPPIQEPSEPTLPGVNGLGDGPAEAGPSPSSSG